MTVIRRSEQEKLHWLHCSLNFMHHLTICDEHLTSPHEFTYRLDQNIVARRKLGNICGRLEVIIISG